MIGRPRPGPVCRCLAGAWFMIDFSQGAPLAVVVFLSVIVAALPAAARQYDLLQGPDVAIRFEPQLQSVAEEVATHYPRLRRDLQQIFGWETPLRPTVFLIGDRQRFARLAASPSLVAYARPGDNVVVIDCSRLHIRPHRLESVLRHEMIHLLLHRHIPSGFLPRWLDEGVAQWLSGGLAELLTAPHPSLLEDALLGGDFIPLAALNDAFALEGKSLMLAYEESRSFVAFVASEYGDEVIFQILNRLKNGSRLQEAFAASLALELREVEGQWLDRLRSRSTWLSYLAVHLYEYLFLAAALLTVIGFIRFVIKKRAYRDEEEL